MTVPFGTSNFILDSPAVDKSLFEQVQCRFAVKAAPTRMPDEIDLTAYLPKQGIKERFND